MNFWFCLEVYKSVKKIMFIVLSVLAVVAVIALISFKGGSYECDRKASMSKDYSFSFEAGVCRHEHR